MPPFQSFLLETVVDKKFIVDSVSPVLHWGINVHLSYLKSWDFHKVPQEKHSCCGYLWWWDHPSQRIHSWKTCSEVRAGCVFGTALLSFCRLKCALTQVWGLSGASPVQCKKVNNWCKRWRDFLFPSQGWKRGEKNQNGGWICGKDQISALADVCCPRAGGGSCCGASQSDGHSWVLHSPDGYETKIHMDWWWIIILLYIIARKGRVCIYSGINVFETLREPANPSGTRKWRWKALILLAQQPLLQQGHDISTLSFEKCTPERGRRTGLEQVGAGGWKAQSWVSGAEQPLPGTQLTTATPEFHPAAAWLFHLQFLLFRWVEITPINIDGCVGMGFDGSLGRNPSGIRDWKHKELCRQGWGSPVHVG